jgi:general secretion pathway protein C
MRVIIYGLAAAFSKAGAQFFCPVGPPATEKPSISLLNIGFSALSGLFADCVNPYHLGATFIKEYGNHWTARITMTTEAKWSDFASMDGAKILAAANRLLPAWLSLLLVVVIAWQLARIIWMLIPAPAAGDPVPAPATQQVSTSQGDSSADVQSIVAAHIFGIADADPEVSAQPIVDDTSNLADTRLTNLKLKGTIAASQDGVAIAIISDGNNEEKVYVIGDSVTSAASLHAVYTDRVVLNESGNLTNLKLPKDFPQGTTSVARRNTTTQTRATTATQSIQSVVAQNVSKLADVIRPTPYFVNGQQQGYRVYPGRDRQQFAALGLRPGDLIKDIDGQALNDPTQAMQIFQSLDSADQVSVTVERNGQPQVIVLRTSQLDLEDKSSQ